MKQQIGVAKVRIAEILNNGPEVRRQALIVGCPDSDIPGVRVDMKNYREFFKSMSGGLWYDNEITTLESPTQSGLQQALDSLKKADYSIVVFAGHGGYVASKKTTMLQLRANVTVDEYTLKFGAPLRTVIIDACRMPVKETLREEFRKSVIAMDSIAHPELSRFAFDNHVRKCAPGLAVMYACSVGQGAGDSAQQGGTYSSILLSEADAWGSNLANKGKTVMSISEAHDRATPLVDRLRAGEQTPDAIFPRTVPRFPFAICA
ncbi:caspase family protein [Paraburkholderia caribensis]|uniref:caspase family protein n=1 Tax=Paraburkholderia caribensis TaxID=75105 RepID=UPI0031D38AC0